jgi:TetR/AcrR family transcriptional repressor of nem operon
MNTSIKTKATDYFSGEMPSPVKRRDENRNRLLRTGADLLSRQSYAATGVDNVIQQAGLTKGTFYHYFKSKERFALEVVQLYAEHFDRKLDRYLIHSEAAPLNRLIAYVRDAVTAMDRDRYARGCLVGNLTQELGANVPLLASALELAFEGWQKRVADCLSLACERGDIKAASDPESLAMLFWAGWEGALLRAKLMQQRKPIDVFFESYLKQFDGRML